MNGVNSFTLNYFSEYAIKRCCCIQCTLYYAAYISFIMKQISDFFMMLIEFSDHENK